jgi:peroxiredoxin Q/BCP
MAQLRRNYERLAARQAIILVIGPEEPENFEAYWRKHRLPFVGLPDPRHAVLKLYGQQVKIFKLGRMPAQVIVDINGQVRFVHYGHSMTDIPPVSDIIAILDEISSEK